MYPTINKPVSLLPSTIHIIDSILVFPNISCTDEVKSNDVKKGVSFAATDSRRTNTAVIVIDFQNEFVRDEGKLHGDVKEMMDRTRMLQKVPHVIRAAR